MPHLKTDLGLVVCHLLRILANYVGCNPPATTPLGLVVLPPALSADSRARGRCHVHHPLHSGPVHHGPVHHQPEACHFHVAGKRV